MLGGGKIVGGHVIAGEGVGHGAHGGKLRADIPIPRHIKELMLQIMGNPSRGMVSFSTEAIIFVDSAVIRDKVGKTFGEALSGHHCHRQTVFQSFPADGFIQLGIVQGIHSVAPFRK